MNQPFLRRVQLFDAATCLGAGLLCTLAAAPLAGLTGLPPGLLRGAGLFLLPFAALVFWSSLMPAAPVVGAVAAANVLWVLAGVGVLLGAGLPVTPLGYAFVAAQAVVVAVIAGLQFRDLRRSGAPAFA